jgi:hypothetical protein
LPARYSAPARGLHACFHQRLDLLLRRVRQLEPVGAEELDPVILAGLWLAEIITPTSARIDGVKSPTAGVGTGPSSSTFIPVEVNPAVSAFSSM